MTITEELDAKEKATILKQLRGLKPHERVMLRHISTRLLLLYPEHYQENGRPKP